MLISLVTPVFALLVIGGIIWVIIEGIVHISKKNKAIDNFLNQVNKVSETYKFATTILFLILATAGISQFYLYYIVSAFLFWLVILTFGIAGIIFLMPYGLCFLPFYKQKKKKQTFKKYMVYTTIGLSICLGCLSLVLVHTTKIYMDEGGVRYYYGSFVMKQAGGYAYLALAVLSTLLIVAKKATNKNKEIETVDNTNIMER
ncbi:hypothetical protein KCX04_00785 [Staphylococcus aureus]|nr:hypothetical protein [Staphylococcus aureus]